MNRCLRDKTLLLIHEGEGNSTQKTHLKECSACATRYQQLTRDLKAISQILRDEPPRSVVSHRFRLVGVRWVAVGSAAATVLLLVWVGVRSWSPSAWLSFTGTSDGENWSMVDDLRANPFLLNEALAFELATEGAAASYELAALVLEADRPCEWYDVWERGEAEFSILELEISAVTPFVFCVESNPNQKKRSGGRKL